MASCYYCQAESITTYSRTSPLLPFLTSFFFLFLLKSEGEKGNGHYNNNKINKRNRLPIRFSWSAFRLVVISADGRSCFSTRTGSSLYGCCEWHHSRKQSGSFFFFLSCTNVCSEPFRKACLEESQSSLRAGLLPTAARLLSLDGTGILRALAYAAFVYLQSQEGSPSLVVLHIVPHHRNE